MLSKGAKILFASQYAGIIGGLENYIFRVSNLLRSQGFKTYSLYMEKTGNADKFLSAFDGTFHVSQIDKMRAEDFDLATLHKINNPEVLESVIAKFSPTAFIHDHDYFCPKGFKYFPYKRRNCTRPHRDFFCGVCCMMVPPRHIKAIGVGNMIKKNFCDGSKLARLVKTCPRFVVLSNFMKGEVETNGISQDRIRVIRPFITMPAEVVSTVKSGKPQLVFAAQQVMSKGTPLFLEAMKKVKSPVLAHVLGTGLRFDDFKKLSADMGLDGKVKFEGFVNDVGEYFAAADMAIFPSLWQEPFGLSGVEAMSYGKPVVGFNVGGVREWLVDGENGIMVPERDTTAMANAIDLLINDNSLREKLGNNARKFVADTYTESKFLDEFCGL